MRNCPRKWQKRRGCPPACAEQLGFALGGDSEILQAVAVKNDVAIFAMLDELMTTLQTIQPRLYDAVLRKLQAVE